ncbi:MAG: hypothetical protein AAGH15_16645 [Myxococcota bacterium]
MRCAWLPILLTLALGACSDLGRAGLGEACLVAADCEDDARCIGTSTERGSLCMAACDPATGPLCDDEAGSVCLATVAGPTVCLLGGEAVEGAFCSFSDDCAPGLICVDLDVEGSVPRCQRACDARSPVCGGLLECQPVGDPAANLGFCRAPDGV